jgi:hypothetical protein
VEKLIEILKGIMPDVDFNIEPKLMDDDILDSFLRCSNLFGQIFQLCGCLFAHITQFDKIRRDTANREYQFCCIYLLNLCLIKKVHLKVKSTY